MEQKPRYKEARLESIRLMVRLSEIRTKNKEQSNGQNLIHSETVDQVFLAIHYVVTNLS